MWTPNWRIKFQYWSNIRGKNINVGPNVLSSHIFQNKEGFNSGGMRDIINMFIPLHVTRDQNSKAEKLNYEQLKFSSDSVKTHFSF